MAVIQFHSSEISGFFAELLNGDSNDRANPIYSFKEKKSSDEDLEGKRWNACINKLHDAVQKGEVQTIEQLTHFVFDEQPGHTFTEEQQAEIRNRLTLEHAKYSAAYQKNASTVEQWAAKNQELENDPKLGYQAELDKLCDFFGVSKNQTFHAILAFTPNKGNEGQAWSAGFIQYSDFREYQTSKNNPEEFIGGTPVQVKKISTPIHEATHIMFKQAGLEEKLNNPQSSGMKRLMMVMEKEIDLNDPEKRVSHYASVRWNAVRAVDEAIAAATGKRVDAKYGKRGNHEWYAGFKPANDLAPFASSLISEYIKQEKQIDDNFFSVLAERFENREKNKEKSAENSSADQKKASSDQRSNVGKAKELQAWGKAKNEEKRATLEQKAKQEKRLQSALCTRKSALAHN